MLCCAMPCYAVQVEGSLLSLLFDPANSHLLSHDASGRVFLDHDPAAFGLLLRHLRQMKAAAGMILTVGEGGQRGLRDPDCP
jgi:hypothetical protein